MKNKQLLTRVSQSFVVFFALVHLAFLGLIFYYFQRLQREQCECALTADYKTLRGILIFLIIYNVLAFVFVCLIYSGLLSNTYLYGSQKAIVGFIGFAVFIVDFIFYILSIKYIRGLYQTSCKCSDNSYRLVYYIYAIVRVVLISIVIVFYLFFVLGMLLMLRK